ncbi:MAG TPA: hypothetical protein VFG59_06605 [Anaeromyxobacter sp.]|nr:hypothetical protein [Anaeromyxobacter sp.]
MNDRRFTAGPFYGTLVDDGSAFELKVARDYVVFVLKSAGRHKLLFLACFLAVVASAAALARVIPNRYRVDATLLVEGPSAIGPLTNPALNRDWDSPIQAALLRRDNLVALCRKTDFVRRHLAAQAPISRARAWVMSRLFPPPPNEPVDPEAQLRSIVDGIEHRLWLSNNGDGTISISFVWTDPELAYDYVQAMLTGYLEARHTAETTQVNETIAILQAHDGEVQRQALQLAVQLDEKERALRGRSTPRRLPFPTVPNAPTPSGPSEETVQLQARLEARQRSLAELEDFRQRKLDDLQAKYTDLLHIYAPEHPQVILLQKQIEDASAPNPKLDQLRSEVRGLQASLDHVAPQPQAQAQTPPPAPVFDLPDLGGSEDHRLDFERAQLNGLLRQHAGLVERIGAAKMEIDTFEAAFKYRYSVVHPPQLPRGPLKPYALVVIVAGVLGGFAFAFFASTVADLIRGRVLERWQIERSLGLTVIGEVER